MASETMTKANDVGPFEGEAEVGCRTETLRRSRSQEVRVLIRLLKSQREKQGEGERQVLHVQRARERTQEDCCQMPVAQFQSAGLKQLVSNHYVEKCHLKLERDLPLKVTVYSTEKA